MIGIIDVIRAYSGALETLLGKPPTTKDLVEVTDRPCTYLQGDVRTAQEGGLRHDVYSLTVVYYAPYHDRGYLDLLRAQEQLSAALKAPVTVDAGFHLCPDAVDIQPIREEMLLICSFNVECWQENPMADWTGGSTDDMDTLELDGETVAAPEAAPDAGEPAEEPEE